MLIVVHVGSIYMLTLTLIEGKPRREGSQPGCYESYGNYCQANPETEPCPTSTLTFILALTRALPDTVTDIDPRR